MTLLHLLLHLTLLMPSTLSWSWSHTLLPCYSHFFSHSCFHALFIGSCLHFVCEPWCSRAFFASSSCLLPCCSHLVIGIVFVAHSLILSRSCWLLAPCVTLSLCLLSPCHCALLPPCHHTLLLPFSSASWPPLPIVISLRCCFTVTPCYYALLVGTPSSHSCASGGAWNNTNKLHPIEVFFF
jgi:hypothetical protein